MSRNACSNENGEKSSKSSNFALTNLTKIRQNPQIHEHSLSLTKFREIFHFRYCVLF